MRRVGSSLLLLMLSALLLSACGGDGIRKRVFPPTVSIQEVAVQADGRWALKLRLQNFSNVAMRFDSIEARLRIGSADAGAVALQPMLSVPPESAEIVDFSLTPASAAANHIQMAQAGRSSVHYTIEGTIRSTEPDTRRDEFKFESQLTVVPGLTGVLR